MGQFCCSNNVGVAVGAGYSVWVGLDVQTSEVDGLLPALDGNNIELEEFLCMLIWGFCFQSSIANFKLHPGEFEYGPAELELAGGVYSRAQTYARPRAERSGVQSRISGVYRRNNELVN